MPTTRRRTTPTAEAGDHINEALIRVLQSLRHTGRVHLHGHSLNHVATWWRIWYRAPARNRRDAVTSPPFPNRVPISRFDGTEASTWPFPETSGSPVWQAWRSAQAALASQQRQAASCLASGVREVLATRRVTAELASDGKQERPAQQVDRLRAANASLRAGKAPQAPTDWRPRPEDDLRLLVGADMAERLARGALHTLGDLEAAGAAGRRWWDEVPGIGPKRARELAARVRNLLNTGKQERAADSVGAPHGAQWFPGVAS